MTVPSPGPIFVHGILPRSGTNFLWDLLLLHPDCAAPRAPVREDLFLAHSDPLAAFVRQVRASWDPAWGTFDAGIEAQLAAGIGDGLLSFLTSDRGRRLVTKSPSVAGLPRFFDFFPDARLVILVRDGRAVAQSAMRTFGWSFERAAHEWRDAADIIQRFEEDQQPRDAQWRRVRYEDLVDAPEAQLRPLLDFLQLDPSRYDFAAARRLPVRGSSVFGRRAEGVHWDAIAKDESFRPTERWHDWTVPQTQRFDWIAGARLAYFGYARTPTAGGALAGVFETARDWRWGVGRAARLMTYRLRGQIALRTRLRAALRRPPAGTRP